MSNNVEYELAFVDTLPQGVQVVDPHTLDFAKNPAGALAFRYKHGWILINPLIPSRGLSGGGLARQHGHISGGHSIGHFVKGADGKMKFKVTDRYASKEEWAKAVKNKAALVGAKQDAVKGAVSKAEHATNQAEKIASEGHPKAVQAAAHKVAAQAHEGAAKAFQAAGEGPAHKSGALTHNAHSAIHASKAAKLEQAAKAEAEAKKAARLKQAGELSAKAHEASQAAQKAHTGLPKDKAEAHAAAAEAHKVAQEANKVAGNAYISSSHGKAAEKHTNIANSQKALHEKLTKAAQDQTDKAQSATLAGVAANKAHADGTGSLDDKIAAQKKAAEEHGIAATMHANLGDSEHAKMHQMQATAHGNAADQFAQDKAKQEALHKAHDEALSAAEKASLDAGGMQPSPEAVKAHKAASKAFMEAKKAAEAAGKKDDAKDHHENAVAHLNHAAKITDDLHKQKVEEEKKQAQLDQAYYGASVEASALSKVAHAEGTHDAHEAALNAHITAAVKGKAAGMGDAVDAHKEPAKAHAEAMQKIKAEEEANAKAKDDAKALSDKAYAASDAISKATDEKAAHLDAAEAHANAATAHNELGNLGLAKKHKDFAKLHLADAAKADEKAVSAQEMGADKPVKVSEPDSKMSAYQAADEEVNKATQKVITSAGLNAQAQADAHYGAAKAHQNAAALAKTAGLKKEAKAHEAQAADHVVSGNKKQAEANLKKKMAQAKAAKAAKAAPSGDKPLKPVGELTNTGRKLGTHGSQLMKDEAGNEWLKKTDDYSRVLDPSIASLQRKVGMETPVFVKTKDGHLQGMLPGAQDAFPNGKFDPAKLSEEDLMKMLQHQVLDYATGNQDTHTGQWLRTSDGKLIQIDQGQAFKFGVGKGSGGYGSGDPTTTFQPLHPNTAVYPKLWEAAKAGQIQIPDPNGDNDFAKAIKAIQDMPDEQFKALFKPYAMEALKNGHKPGGNATVDGFLDDIVKHKNNIGKDFQKLYDGLPESAKGTKAAPEAPSKAGVAEKASAPSAGALTPKEAALKALAEHENPANSSAWTFDKSGELEKAAKDAGATGDEIQKSFTHPTDVIKELEGKSASAETPKAAPSGLSAKDAALQKVADYSANPPETWSPKTYMELTKAAVNAGATPSEVHAAKYDSQKVLADLQAKAASGAKPSKDDALKAFADHSKLPDGEWSASKHKELKEAAKAAGASSHEINAAFKSAMEKVDADKAEAEKPAAPAPAAAAPKAKPAVDPFKPKAKWSKTTHGVHKLDGEHIADVDALQGPKGLAVHKPVGGGKGFVLSTADGLKLGPTFKTQKEAKLAGEWVAANFGNSHFTKETFDNFKQADPEAFQKLKQGMATQAWNTEAQAEADKLAGKAVPEAAAPKATGGTMSSKEAALKALAEHSLPENSADWDYDKGLSLKEAAKAAGATEAEAQAAQDKPKTFLKTLEGKAAPAQEIKFTGLTGNKVANAKLLKQLYDQAHGPNATAAMKADYEKAQAAWQKQHSTGPFDPSKYVAPPEPLSPGAGNEEKTKKWFPASHAAGFTVVGVNESANGDWKPTKSQAMGPKYYTSTSGCNAMNAQLRGEKEHGYDAHGNYVVTGTKTPTGYPGGSQDKYIKSCDEAFAAVPPLDKDIVVCRVMSGYKPFDAYPPPMNPGSEYTDLGYGSTSKVKGTWSGDFHMEIQIPAGRKVLDLNHTSGSHYSHENEILLNRGSTFRVVSDTMVGGNRKVVVQLVNDGHFG